MRIRKYASKVLHPHSPSDASSTTTARLISESSPCDQHISCKLNCSPWDALPIHSLLEEGEFYGALMPINPLPVNNIAHFPPPPPPPSNRALIVKDLHKSSGDDRKAVENNRTNNRRPKNKPLGKKEAQAAFTVKEEEKTNGNTTICKKSDGKGWNCKRQAKHPYSLCDYHLSQIRAYYYGNHKSQPAASRPRSHGKSDRNHASKNKIKRQTNTSGGGSKDAEPEFYYYYSGFGPWRGKLRGGCNQNNDHKDDNLADSCSPAPVDEDDYDAGLDPECIDDVDELNDDFGSCPLDSRRRGRKPVKARSLKSLL